MGGIGYGVVDKELMPADTGTGQGQLSLPQFTAEHFCELARTRAVQVVCIIYTEINLHVVFSFTACCCWGRSLKRECNKTGVVVPVNFRS